MCFRKLTLALRPVRPRLCSLVRQEEWTESGGQEEGKGDGCGRRMRFLKLNPNLEMFGRREQKRGTF